MSAQKSLLRVIDFICLAAVVEYGIPHQGDGMPKYVKSYCML